MINYHAYNGKQSDHHQGCDGNSQKVHAYFMRIFRCGVFIG
jgi:hypothetical protein